MAKNKSKNKTNSGVKSKSWIKTICIILAILMVGSGLTMLIQYLINTVFH